MPLRRRRFWSPVLLSCAIAVSGGCNVLLGLDDFKDAAGQGGGGGSTASGGPDGGGGPGGGGPATFCEPESTIACYTGPERNKGVGNCVLGVQTCAGDGSAYGACVGDVKPERDEDCELAGDEDCDGKVCSDALWSALYGSEESQYGPAVAVDADGNIIVAGIARGAFSIGEVEVSAANYELLVAKLGPAGEPIWARQFDLGGNIRIGGVAADEAGNIVVGVSADADLNLESEVVDADNLVMKLDPGGEVLWAKGFGGSSGGHGPRVAVFGGGRIAVAGRFGTTIRFDEGSLTSAGEFDAFLALLDADGVDLQRARYGGAQNEWISSLAVHGSAAVVAGFFNGALTLGSTAYPAPSDLKSGMFVARVDLFSGASIGWSKAFYARELQATSIAAHPQAGIFLAGTFNEAMSFDPEGEDVLQSAGGGDVYLLKLTGQGAYGFSQRFGDFGTQNDSAVAVDEGGNVILALGGQGTVDFGGDPLASSGGEDIFLAKMDLFGAHLWSKRFGDPETQYPGKIAVNPSSQIVLVGTVEGTVDFGDGPRTSAGNSDLAIAVFAP
ncbi:hypothetical protein [Sorangium sp. So ce131]|uniref:hypothetical protein n=1 Tax=Sorangium sp. So ce131 TaxID=3133282 RepID=UPI003F60E03A